MIRSAREWIATHGPGYLHGGAWKLAATACKFAFLIYFAPKMLDGEFSLFLFWQSTALLVARAASIGLADELPVRIRGKAEEARQFWPLLLVLQIVSLAGLAIAWCTESLTIAALALVLVLVPGSILGGVIRTWQPNWYERALNWPWLVFIAALAFGGTGLALQTLHLYATAFFLAQLAVLFAVQPSLGESGERSVRRLIPVEIASLARHGSLKMLSEFTLLANSRALVLLPVILVGSLQSDRISLSLAVADAVAGLFMVIVNRNYVLYCRSHVKPRHVLISGSFIIASMTALGGLALMATNWTSSLLATELKGSDLVWACMLFGAITAYYDARYFYWARGAGARGSIALQLAALAGQTAIIFTVQPALWLPTTACVVTLAVLGFGWVLLSRSTEAKERG